MDLLEYDNDLMYMLLSASPGILGPGFARIDWAWDNDSLFVCFTAAGEATIDDARAAPPAITTVIQEFEECSSIALWNKLEPAT